ncbi:MAG TPA: cytochrome ubiquinol oxidase subunit I [Caldisericia bacterium]|nr:cytochrome ubiquinol oxidase subunit I [Caldisericia bacterium]HPF49681.1 cytochrome ubiquinol oxidase subunit I [Caldisericia bacterium]HPI84546.1 cytochrome ubiquinol oxidase subunit I [Caldisericia bacterium]HPQ93661.1 cytochrome ubiquinol oxidase subunit I [Caldisericia bacterium]HRV74775.1 cytochrome ubiquinol oxidase subunit I [Caldisericia bacterium]
MDVMILSRIQFAQTAAFHFIFPPLTIGMAFFLVWLMHRWHKSGAAEDRNIAKFWINIFALTFVVGAVSGIVLEFQFGTNWSQYSRFVGDIFGAPLAAEGILAFFLESSFLGVLLLGWNKLSKKTLLVAAWMIAIGTLMSAFWILLANSWMQTPAGYEVINGRAVLTDFWAALFNPSILPRFLHTITASAITGSFFVAGMMAYLMKKNLHIEFAKKSLKVVLLIALIASVAQVGFGHYHSVQVANTQPAKLAAFEGIYNTTKDAPLLLWGIPDSKNETVHMPIGIPKGLGFAIGLNPDMEFKGLNDFPENQRPPVGVVFQSYHIMVLLGFLFILIPIFGLWLFKKKRVLESRWFIWVLLIAMPLPIIANWLGWIAAEMGRLPWVVYGVMRISEAFSPNISSGEVLFSILMFAVVFAVIISVWIALVRKKLLAGPDAISEGGAK